MAYNYGNYNYQPPQYTNFMQQPTGFNTNFVSDIAEAIATKPDVTGKPLFFYNKASEEIYIKQYDSTGAAPVKTYKLAIETQENKPNQLEEGFKSLDSKLDDIKKLLTPPITNEEFNRRDKR